MTMLAFDTFKDLLSLSFESWDVTLADFTDLQIKNFNLGEFLLALKKLMDADSRLYKKNVAEATKYVAFKGVSVFNTDSKAFKILQALPNKVHYNNILRLIKYFGFEKVISSPSTITIGRLCLVHAEYLATYYQVFILLGKGKAPIDIEVSGNQAMSDGLPPYMVYPGMATLCRNQADISAYKRYVEAIDPIISKGKESSGKAGSYAQKAFDSQALLYGTGNMAAVHNRIVNNSNALASAFKAKNPG